jgi:hypothetical protein
MKKFLTVFLPVACCGTFAMAQQVGCLATNSSVIGSYTYTATELPIAGVVVTPPGTNPNQQIYSNTSLGKLIGGINGGGPLSSSGVLYFDGAGNISVTAASSPLGTSTAVGTYNVNGDCTINVKLIDVFNTTTSGPGITNPTLGSTNLIGLVLGGGTEIDLSAPQSPSSTNGNMPVVTGEFASRLNIQLIRGFTYGCGVASLNGAYGLVANGFALVNATTAQPVTFFARLRFDGNGNIIPDTVTSPSPLASFQYVGTYTVNLDCSGSMTLGPVPSATGSTTTPSITASFVLIPPVAYVANGTATLSGSADRPSIEFTLMGTNQTLFGFGRPQ